MKNKVVTVLVVILLVLVLLVGGALGFIWYRNNHVFVEGDAYPLDAQSIDLREKDISFYYYDKLKEQLPECTILWNVPFQDVKISSDAEVLTITELREGDIPVILSYFPNLRTLDATSGSGQVLYQMLEAFREAWPEGEILYEVDLGGVRPAPDTTELVLENGDYDFDTLLQNLAYLRKLTSLKLRTPELTMEQVDELKAAYENIAVSCTVEILGREYDNRVTDLDLRDLESSQVAEVAAKLPMLPNVTYVELTKEDGTSQLTKADVKTLKTALPGASFHYTFDFYGETLSTTDEQVHIKNKAIGDDGIGEVREVLDIMENCQRFVLEYCQISYDLLAEVREEYRDKTKLVWRVEFGGGSAFTDVEVIRCTYDLVDDNCHNLIYCEDVRFMDIGHNEWLDAVPFVAGMPNLEGIIVSGAPIKDLTPFENCKKLKFLEIGFCEYIEDLTPLAGCESLEMLNISNTHALDLSPLDNLPLTHLCARTNPSGRSRVPQEEQERVIAQHPDCWITFAGAQPYGVGWRYDEDEITPLPYYAMLRRVFKYDESIIPNNVGWYLEEGITDLDYKET